MGEKCRATLKVTDGGFHPRGSQTGQLSFCLHACAGAWFLIASVQGCGLLGRLLGGRGEGLVHGGGGFEEGIFYLDVLAILCRKQPGEQVNAASVGVSVTVTLMGDDLPLT